jgi:hypothetical protein
VQINVGSGLMSVDQKADWQRSGQGGENVAANALLCGVLRDASDLAKALGDAPAAALFKEKFTALQTAINTGDIR